MVKLVKILFILVFLMGGVTHMFTARIVFL